MVATNPKGERAGSHRFASQNIFSRMAVACVAVLAVGASLSSARANMGNAADESPWIADSAKALASLRPAYAPAVFDESATVQSMMTTFNSKSADSTQLAGSLRLPADAPVIAGAMEILPAQTTPVLALLSESSEAQMADSAGFFSHHMLNINALFNEENSVAALTGMSLPRDASTELYFRDEPMFAMAREEYLVPVPRKDEQAS